MQRNTPAHRIAKQDTIRGRFDEFVGEIIERPPIVRAKPVAGKVERIPTVITRNQIRERSPTAPILSESVQRNHWWSVRCSKAILWGHATS